MIDAGSRVIVRLGDVAGLVLCRNGDDVLVSYTVQSDPRSLAAWFPLNIVHPAPKEKEKP